MEEISDKTLSLGCIIKFKSNAEVKNNKEPIGFMGKLIVYKYVRHFSSSSEGYDWYKIQEWECCFSDMRNWELKFIVQNTRETKYRSPYEQEIINDELVNKYFDIIWHNVYISDVLDWFWKNANSIKVWWMKEKRDTYNKIIWEWTKKREPIENQIDWCVDYIYSLIQQVKWT